MNHRLFPVLAIVTMLAIQVLPKPLPASEPQAPLQPPASGTIRGIVSRAGSSEPIADVFISATNRGGGARGGEIQIQELLGGRRGAAAAPLSPLTMKSDRTGHFVFESLPVGLYEVRAELEGYFGPESNGAFPTYVSTIVTVDAARQTTPELTFSLIQGATITGRVSEADDRPAVLANVQALRAVYQNGFPVLQAEGTYSTDDRGDYRLFRLPPGEYYIAAAAAQSARNQFAGARGGRAVPAGSVRTFYPGTVDVSTARLVVVASGEEVPGMNIAFRDTHTIRVSGQVVNTIPFSPRIGPRGNTQTTPVQLTLVPHDRNALADPNSTNAGSVALEAPANGQFEISGILPGSYDVFARVQNPNSTVETLTAGTQPSVYFARTSFESRYDDVQNLSLVVRPGVDLKIHVTVDGNAAAASGIVRVALQSDDSAHLIPAYARGGVQPPLPGADGMIIIPFVNEGLYRIQTVIAPAALAAALGARGQRGTAGTIGPNLAAAYVEDIRENGVSVYDNGLNVGSRPAGTIELLMKTNGGIITGVVVDSKLNPQAGALVALVPPEGRRQNPALYKTATSDATGKFTIRGIAPGTYKLFAWDSLQNGAYQNPAFLSKYEERGRAVNVMPAIITNEQVTVIATDKGR